jgi:hypothetical protein
VPWARLQGGGLLASSRSGLGVVFVLWRHVGMAGRACRLNGRLADSCWDESGYSSCPVGPIRVHRGWQARQWRGIAVR